MSSASPKLPREELDDQGTVESVRSMVVGDIGLPVADDGRVHIQCPSDAEALSRVQSIASVAESLGQQQVPPSFDGFENGAETQSNGSRNEDPDLLTPFETHKKCMEAFSPCRLATLVLLVIAAMLWGWYVDEERFSAWASVDNVPGYDDCLAICEETKDPAKAAEFGGTTAVCRQGTGVDEDPSILVQVCIKKKCGHKNLKPGETYVPKQVGEFVRCKFKIVKPIWKAMVTAIVFVSVIGLIVQDLPAHLLLIAGAAFLCACGIISRDAVFKGLNSSGICSLAVIFPISEAIQETGLLDYLIGRVLGSPKNTVSAVLHMMFPVAILSGFLMNSACTALMMPILATWARRLDLSPGKLLMPLSFAAQLGGGLTLLGSSTCMVTYSVMLPEYEMSIFDLTILGAPIMVVTVIVTALAAATPLLSSSAEDTGGPAVVVDPAIAYTVAFVVESGGGIADKTIEESGLRRVPGVIDIWKRHRSGLVTQHRGVSSDVPMSLEVPLGADVSSSELLHAKDELEVTATITGIIALRSQGGIKLLNSTDLELLGGKRRSRFIYEVSVAIDSEFCCTDILRNPERLRQELGCAFIAGPKGTGVTFQDDVDIAPGSAIILEADCRWVDKFAAARWRSAFSLVRKIPNSSPLRVGGPVDNIRGLTVCGGMVVVIVLCSIPKTGITLDIGGIVFLTFLVGIRALTVNQMFGSMRYQILLVVAGAMAMGQALQNTGIVGYLADVVLGATESMGHPGVLGAVYALTVFLGMWINNAASVAILAPMVKSICIKDPTLPLAPMAWTLTYAAGTCCTTPLGYQTNLMVMGEGKYKMKDFLKFGGVIQLTHMVATIGFVMLYLKFKADPDAAALE